MIWRDFLIVSKSPYVPSYKEDISGLAKQVFTTTITLTNMDEIINREIELAPVNLCAVSKCL